MRDLLVLLGDGKFHSGEELGECLGMTRAAVWKRLKKLEEKGVRIHSVKGKGYRIPDPITLLNEHKIRSYGISPHIDIAIPFEVDSTNDRLKQRINDKKPLPALVVTERQTNGKGRRGRVWESGVARNITLSFGWQFQVSPVALEGLSLAVGVCVARVLQRLGIQDPGLKWPNDLLLDGKKVCGVLVEMVADQDACNIIIGIGLNLSMAPEFMQSVHQPWTDLASRLAVLPDRNEVIALLTLELIEMCRLFEKGDGMASYRSQWQQFDILIDQSVTVTSAERHQYGTARGIDVRGGLVLELEDGQLVTLHGGEISVRKQ
ncbi:biotin--[acetyl-CoA-carboxylase] ligase [Maribrevibacterium harenarium]|uniref:Bifunctional ligase/repressor BirA n=1 Tax=Maribrevibacterium harenarium TaxID=2589817 RepID=A0A501WNX1_9GAMM|nr:biotin--[acetyl-CoA-carboxylase] ligase [Maribrevibacterium harenarium]TPE50030.1 biotin--[acetyl-CoA-carboxylase] ligase [Maribrevibacterium harenarium]